MTNLKDILFFRTAAEYEAYTEMNMRRSTWTEEEIDRQRDRFCSAYQIVEEAELEDEYQAWKEAHASEFTF
ncbi:MAG TPA: hypothetical protein PLN48_07545 [Lachnospiraceae bacterium]|jgi:hypothetical protein|nr:hypothetical protein [Lachnospiraceae bacterium]